MRTLHDRASGKVAGRLGTSGASSRLSTATASRPPVAQAELRQPVTVAHPIQAGVLLRATDPAREGEVPALQSGTSTSRISGATPRSRLTALDELARRLVVRAALECEDLD